MNIWKLLCGVLLGLAFISEAPASETTNPVDPIELVNDSEAMAEVADADGTAAAEESMADAADSTAESADPAIAADSLDMPAAPDPAAPESEEALLDDAATPDLAASESDADSLDVPAAPDPGASPSEAVSDAPAPARTLGRIGYDSEGRSGRIHVVVRGDTLWDISDAYLGTPWVWPSIWTDNRNIEDPHLIHPEDRIWITDSEMRVISRAEAEAMLNAGPSDSDAFPADQIDTVEVTPVDPPAEIALVPEEQITRRVSVREWVGLLSPEELDAAASIVKRVPAQLLLAQMDDVYIGLGEGDVEVGEKFEIVRKDTRVVDPATKRFLGHHVTSLGWLEVVEVHPETSLAKIKRSTGDIWVGDKLLPRHPESIDITIQPSPEDVSGEIVFFPNRRVVIGQLDFVYLNRGTLDGLETGSPLEVVRGEDTVREEVRRTLVDVPNRVVAKLLVVDAKAETSVALVAEAETDLLVGDTFRGHGF